MRSTLADLQAAPRLPMQVQVESLPVRFHEHARDWSELAATRLLAEPLFVEVPGRGLRSRLVEDCRRVDPLSWRLTLGIDARWNTGDRMIVSEICRQIVRARLAGAAPLTAAMMIKSMTVVSRYTVQFDTRIPIAHLDRILANPGLAPRHPVPEVTTGPYLLEHSFSNRIELKSVRDTRPINLLLFPRIDDVDPFGSEQVHVSGPMSTCPADWLAVSRSTMSTLRPLDIVYVLILPKWLPPNSRYLLQLGLDRRRVCEQSNGSVIPCGRMSDLWSGKKTEGSKIPLKTKCARWASNGIDLFYTNFPANREIAIGVAQELLEKFQIGVTISPRDYEEFISGSREEYANAFRLALITSPWPHPVGMLAPFFFGAESPPLFRKIFSDAATAEDLESAAVLAAQAEDILVNCGSRVVTIGRTVGCLRSRVGEFWCPPSGWIDYSQLTDH